MKKNVIVLPQKPTLEKKVRVAAYARVSTGKDMMLHSLSNQVSYYSKLIQGNNEWLYAGVYVDEAVTGTKDERADFQRMISDAKAGKIDAIITKSISRFARNTVTLLETVRELKPGGVDVYFEEEGIHTLSSDGELMLSILASYAQEESRQVSENMKWRIKRDFEKGKPWGFLVYGYVYRNGKIDIIPEEARVVRFIYDYFLSGMGVVKIAKKLNEEGYRTRKCGRWSKSSVRTILSNYDYTGNLILQKTYSENHITKKKLFNNGELPKYHAQYSHEGIVSVEEFRLVQEEFIRRDSLFNKKEQSRISPFTRKLLCDKCGSYYRRKSTPYKPVWKCGKYLDEGKASCCSSQVPEEVLYELSSDFKKEVGIIEVCDNNTLIFKLTDGTEVTKKWKYKPRSESWTPEKRELARRRSKEQWQKLQ